VYGSLSLYEQRGELSFVVDFVQAEGAGVLAAEFERRRAAFEAEGLFALERKRPLPRFPRRVGVVTSPAGAVFHDIADVLARRWPLARLLLQPAPVQGEGAGAAIAEAIRTLARVQAPDVIIVARGGGAAEDLWAFNEEAVVRAIFGSPIPVVSAVGHETDVTLADMVADLRAPTPSAAAELVVSAKDEFVGRIDRLHGRLRAAARARVQGLSRRVHIVDGRPAFAGFRGRIAMRGRHAAELSHALARVLRAALATRERRRLQLERQLTSFDAGRRLASIRTRLVASQGRLDNAVRRRQHRAAAQLGNAAGRLETLSPLAVLGRGYAVAWSADRTHALRDASTVAPGDTIHVTLSRGEIDAKVTKAE